MPLDEVVADLGRVARPVGVGHAELLALPRNVFHVMGLHVEALGTHVLHPLPAATAIRALVHIDRGPSQGGACHQAQHGRQDQRLQFHDDSFDDWDGSFWQAHTDEKLS